MASERDQDTPEIRLDGSQRARLNAAWRSGLVAARAAAIIRKIKSEPRRSGDNQSRREKRIEIVRMYAGLGQPPLTQSEIAVRLGISRQRVQQVVSNAGLDASVRVAPLLTRKFLRHFGERMKAQLISAGYRQCYACRLVTFAGEMSTRDRGRWRGVCKRCCAAEMRHYRAHGHYPPHREKRKS